MMRPTSQWLFHGWLPFSSATERLGHDQNDYDAHGDEDNVDSGETCENDEKLQTQDDRAEKTNL